MNTDQDEKQILFENDKEKKNPCKSVPSVSIRVRPSVYATGRLVKTAAESREYSGVTDESYMRM